VQTAQRATGLCVGLTIHTKANLLHLELKQRRHRQGGPGRSSLMLLWRIIYNISHKFILPNIAVA